MNESDNPPVLHGEGPRIQVVVVVKKASVGEERAPRAQRSGLGDRINTRRATISPSA